MLKLANHELLCNSHYIYAFDSEHKPGKPGVEFQPRWLPQTFSYLDSNCDEKRVGPCRPKNPTQTKTAEK